jgi:hypothetical protein
MKNFQVWSRTDTQQRTVYTDSNGVVEFAQFEPDESVTICGDPSSTHSNIWVKTCLPDYPFTMGEDNRTETLCVDTKPYIKVIVTNSQTDDLMSGVSVNVEEQDFTFSGASYYDETKSSNSDGEVHYMLTGAL